MTKLSNALGRQLAEDILNPCYRDEAGRSITLAKAGQTLDVNTVNLLTSVGIETVVTK